MIKQIDKKELLKDFITIVEEVEFGNHCAKYDTRHVRILNDRIDIYLSRNAVFFGMYADNDMDAIGFVTGVKNFHLSHKNDCEILEIGVNRKYRKQGYGTRLLDHIESYYRADDVHCIFVETYAADFQVIYFYGKNGYVPVSVVPDTNGPDDEGTIIMRKLMTKKSCTTSGRDMP